MDNASKDGTEVLLKEYKNAGFLSFFSEPDRGKFDAMNKGILRAKGKYVSFLSCDDFYHDITAIADIVNVMEEEDADFCFFPCERLIQATKDSLFQAFSHSHNNCWMELIFKKRKNLRKCLTGFCRKEVDVMILFLIYS